MKVTLHPADQAGCGMFRIRYPAEQARNESVETHVTPDVAMMYVDRPGPRKMRPQPTTSDVIVLQRPAKLTTLECIPHWQRAGVAVVVDIDDDFSAMHPQHPARDIFNPALHSDVNSQHLHRACSLADLVTVTTPALAERYGSHGRVMVLPNCVPKAMLEMESESDGQTLGWGGAAVIHPGDLEVPRGGVAEALSRMCWKFLVVGPADHVKQRLALAEEPDATGWLSVDEYQQELGRMNVGIIPLGDSRFNEAKSWLKGLEYAARGVPFVASPLPEYRALAEEGIGLLAADRSRNWRSQLVQLMDDESLRWEMAERGKAIVAERHTFETEGWRWAEAWHIAMETRRRGRRHEPRQEDMDAGAISQGPEALGSAPDSIFSYSGSANTD